MLNLRVAAQAYRSLQRAWDWTRISFCYLARGTSLQRSTEASGVKLFLESAATEMAAEIYPVLTLLLVAPLWCDLGFFPNSRDNKAAANLRPIYQQNILCEYPLVTAARPSARRRRWRPPRSGRPVTPAWPGGRDRDAPSLRISIST